MSHFFVNITLRMEVAINITSQSSIIHAVLEIQFQSVNFTLVRICKNYEQNKPLVMLFKAKAVCSRF